MRKYRGQVHAHSLCSIASFLSFLEVHVLNISFEQHFSQYVYSLRMLLLKMVQPLRSVVFGVGTAVISVIPAYLRESGSLVAVI